MIKPSQLQPRSVATATKPSTSQSEPEHDEYALDPALRMDYVDDEIVSAFLDEIPTMVTCAAEPSLEFDLLDFDFD